MSQDPKRLADGVIAADPDLAARVRADLRIARGAQSGYDTDAGLARLSAAISGGGAPGGGAGKGAGGGGAGHVASVASGSLAVKAGVAGLVALGAIGVAIGVGSAKRAPVSAASSPLESCDERHADPAPRADGVEHGSRRGAGRAADLRGGPRRPRGAVHAEAEPVGAGSASAGAGATIRPEMEQFQKAQRALASDPGRALALAQEGHARFPRGVFWQEREALAIRALMKLGRSGEAKARARAFVERHPESPLADGLRKLSGGA